MTRWLWRTAAAIGGVLLVAVIALPTSLEKQWSWLALSLLALAGTLVGPRLHPPVRRHQGWLLVLAMAGFVTTNVLSIAGWSLPGDHLVHLVSSLLFPVSYLLIGAAMIRLAAARATDGDPEGRIDGLLVLIATAAVLYDLITAPGVASTLDPVDRTIFASLPIIQAPVIAAVFRLLITGGHRSPTAWFFLAAASGGLVGNIVFVLDVGGPWLSVAWGTAYLGVALGTLHPSAALLSGSPSVDSGRLSFGRLAVIGSALLALPAAMVLGQGGALSTSVPAIAAAACVILVLWRIARLLREREGAAAELAARAEREAALSALGHAAVAEVEAKGFLDQVNGTVAEVLDVACEIVPRPSASSTQVPPSGTIEVPIGDHDVALRVTWREGATPRAETERFVRTVADLAGAALRRWQLEAQLRHRSLHDPLTELPNRSLTLDRLTAALGRASRTGGDVGVLFLDLDGFKAVNDRFGHAAGDELLIGVAQRLRHGVRPGDTVGRLAGDEFVVLCDDTSRDQAEHLAERLDVLLRRPFGLELGEVSIGASIGIALAAPGDDPEQVLRDADAAMYEAKRRRSGVARPAAASAP
jgi:diguanylate cyclase (GGDEF)-like protein